MWCWRAEISTYFVYYFFSTAVFIAIICSLILMRSFDFAFHSSLSLSIDCNFFHCSRV